MHAEQARAFPILHSYDTWLHTVEDFLYTQARFLPEPIVLHILCDRVANTDRFGWPRLCCAADQPHWKTLPRQFLRRIHMPMRDSLLIDIVRQQRIQLLHSHGGSKAFANLVSAKAIHIKHVVTLHDFEPERFSFDVPGRGRRYRRLFDAVDAVFCDGSHAAHVLEEQGCPAEKVRIHHFGIDLTTFPFVPRHWSGNEPLEVLLVASFHEEKGILDALKALVQLKKEVDFRVTLIDNAMQAYSSPNQVRRILKTILSEELAQNVRLVGYQPREIMVKAAHHHHLFLVPNPSVMQGSMVGGTPVTIAQLMATGMPGVAIRHHAVSEIFGESGASLLVDERDIDGLAARLLELASRPASWEALATALRTHVAHEYNATLQGQRLANAYLELAG